MTRVHLKIFKNSEGCLSITLGFSCNGCRCRLPTRILHSSQEVLKCPGKILQGERAPPPHLALTATWSPLHSQPVPLGAPLTLRHRLTLIREGSQTNHSTSLHTVSSFQQMSWTARCFCSSKTLSPNPQVNQREGAS